MSLRFTLVLLLAFLPLQPVSAMAFTLYDSSVVGEVPGDQPWLFAGIVSGESAITGGVNLATNNIFPGGYSNYIPFPNFNKKNSGFPSLDRTLGFSLAFELEVNSETHNNANRAGFSVLLLANDTLGIEIGFWENLVWAQNVGFTHGEEAGTTPGKHLYELAMLGNNYALSVDGAPLLSGGLRDYSGFGPPYNIADFLFFGDDTSSALANVNLGQITLNTNEPASVPLPSATLLLLSGLPLLRRFRGKQPV